MSNDLQGESIHSSQNRRSFFLFLQERDLKKKNSFPPVLFPVIESLKGSTLEYSEIYLIMASLLLSKFYLTGDVSRLYTRLKAIQIGYRNMTYEPC